MLALCYHAVSERWPAALSIAPAALEEQLRLLVDRGYRGATFGELVGGGRSDKLLAITFDDAFRSVIERARPILSSLGLPGTVFVPTGFAGTGKPMAWDGIDHWLGGPHEPELIGMGWDELDRLAGEGWEIGSHTRTHPRLTELDDRSLAMELRGSRAECEERLGRECRSLAYPYGDVDGRVMRAAAEAGYQAAGALPQGRVPPAEPLRWPRIGVYRVDRGRRFRLKVSPAGRRLRGSPAWGALERARRAL